MKKAAAIAGVARVTISLPQALHAQGENERRRRGITRSEFVADLYRKHLDHQEDERRAARYSAAYARQPETEDEAWAADHSAALLFGEAAGSADQGTAP